MAVSDVACGFCLFKNEQMVDPKELACGHNHCSPCLIGRKEAYNVVECPSAGCKHVYSEDIQQLPNADLGVETSQVKCDNCEEDAVIYCTHNLCRKRFCRKHKQLHAEFHKDHKTVGVKEHHLKSAKYETRHCEVHTAEELIAGCRTCLQFLCLQCLEDHTACKGGPHKVATLKTLSGEARETLTSLRDRAEKRKTELASVIKQSEEKLSNHSEEMQRKQKMLGDTRDEELEAIRKTYAIEVDALQKEYDRNEIKFVEFRDETVEAEISHLTREAQMITGTLNGAHEVDTIVKSREIQKRLATVIGDQLPTWDVPDKMLHSDDAIQLPARTCEPPVDKVVEFSEGQFFGKGNISVLPRLQKKLLEHFEPDKLFNHLFAETGLNVNPNSWCLTGYFFQLKLAEDCLKRLEKDADQKAKAQGGGHLQGTSKQAFSDVALENEHVVLSAASRNKPLPDDEFETDKSDESSNPEKSAAEREKSNAGVEPGTPEESKTIEVQSKMKRIKVGSSYVYRLDDKFDKIFYEFMTTVWKEKFQRKVTGKFSGKMSETTNPKDARELLVTIESLNSEQTRDMMAALNRLYSKVVRTVHSHTIKLQYEGDKGLLAKSLEQDLPDLYLGEKLVARLVTNEDIRIIGLLMNIDHDIHVVETFVSDFKRRHPAPPVAKANPPNFMISNGTVMRVIRGDLTKVKCDAIVSSSGRDLSHKRGVSRAIANACGQKFMKDGQKHIQKNGEMRVGETFVQNADGGPKARGVKFVIHVIAPPPADRETVTQQLLKKAILNALLEAEKLKCKTVALPAICAGNMGVAIDVCAECYWNAAMIFGTQSSSPRLKEIIFVVDDETVVREIEAVFKLRTTSTHTPSSADSTSHPSRSAASVGNSANLAPIHKGQKLGEPTQSAEKPGGAVSARLLLERKSYEEPVVDKTAFTPLEMDAFEQIGSPVAGKVGPQRGRTYGQQMSEDNLQDIVGRQGKTDDRRNDPYGPGGRHGTTDDRKNDPYGPDGRHGTTDDKRNDPHGSGGRHGTADDKGNDPYRPGGIHGTTDNKGNDPYRPGGRHGTADDRRNDPYRPGGRHGTTDDRRIDHQGRYVEFQGAGAPIPGMHDQSQGSVEPGKSGDWGVSTFISGAVNGAIGSLASNFGRPTSLSAISAASGNQNPAASSTGSSQPQDNECPICMDNFTDPKTLPCSHRFCRNCLDQVVSKGKSNLCPTCRAPFTKAEGKQPKGGRMTTRMSYVLLPGHNDCGSITISYDFSPGTQGPEHPHPGQRYSGTSRIAYLPDNAKGKLVAKLLKKAFDQRLVFTVGQSVTTGMDNCVVWNDIHHKTNMTGGPSNYGYPDPGYLDRLIDDLKAKGISE